MSEEMVAPSHLHRMLEQAKDAGEKRQEMLGAVLHSLNLAVIRRIPVILAPLSDREKEMIAQWAERTSGQEDVSSRDFAFHLMVNCDVPAERIIGILERNHTFSRSALEHIQQMFRTGGDPRDFEIYMAGVAEALVAEERVPSRDRARHILMTLARTEDDWRALAVRFSETEVADLRQRILERFLQECPDGSALVFFVGNIARMCMDAIAHVAPADVHREAAHMHWGLMCLERIGRRDDLSRFVSLLQNKFGTALPYSVQGRIEYLFPTRVYTRADRGLKLAPTETNAQVAARLGITKRQVAKMRQRGEV